MSVMHRRAWDPNRRFLVTVGSRWKRDGEDGVWTVTELWGFEQGSGRTLHAVTITEQRSRVVRRMSQARLLNTMRELAPSERRPITTAEVERCLHVGAEERKLAERTLKRSPRR